MDPLTDKPPRRRGQQSRGWLWGLAAGVIIGLGFGLGIAALAMDRGTRVYSAVDQDLFRAPRVITRAPTTLRTLRFVAHGGRTRIQWYNGAWMPLHPRTGSYVSIHVDGKARASALQGGRTGRDEASPGTLIWFGRLSPGLHVIEVIAARVDSGFAIPYGAADFAVPDSLSVVEYVD